MKIQFQFSVKINFSHLYSFIYHMISAVACGRMISSRLKYSRNALYINVLPFARYFRQRFAPFIRHRRRSQGYPYRIVQTVAILRSGIIYFYIANCLHELGAATRCRRLAVRADDIRSYSYARA